MSRIDRLVGEAIAPYTHDRLRIGVDKFSVQDFEEVDVMVAGNHFLAILADEKRQGSF